MPRPDNAIFALARALAKVSEYETPVLLTPSTRQFFQALGRTADGPMREHFRNLTSDDPALVSRADAVISQDPLLRAIMRNTLAPVMINGGFRGNVIPGSAQATVNARLIPGSDIAGLVSDIRRVIADTSIEIRTPASRSSPVAESPDTTELFRALARQAKRQCPWRARGVPVYGIYPYPIDADDLSRMHGNDERVSIESLRQGTEMIYRTLVEIAGRSAR
jgi:acetylornithine deacetylase/succinyl-diaminopimelate desuccinylase-like protein